MGGENALRRMVLQRQFGSFFIAYGFSVPWIFPKRKNLFFLFLVTQTGGLL